MNTVKRCPKCKQDCVFTKAGVQFIDEEYMPFIKAETLARTFLLEGKHAFLLLNCENCGCTYSHSSINISNEEARYIEMRL